MRADKITSFSSKKEEKEYDEIRKEVYGDEEYEYWKRHDKETERNLIGREYEKSGKVDEAIKLYEQNLKEDSTLSFYIRRLSIIYRRRKQYDDEIRVLKRAIQIFKDRPKFPKVEVQELLIREFRERLEKTKDLKRRDT